MGIQVLWTERRHEWTHKIAGMRKVVQLVNEKEKRGGSEGFKGEERLSGCFGTIQRMRWGTRWSV